MPLTPPGSPPIDTSRNAGRIVGMIRKLIEAAMRNSIQELITPQFQAMHARLDQIDRRLDAIEAWFDRFDRRSEAIGVRRVNKTRPAPPGAHDAHSMCISGRSRFTRPG